MVNKAEPLHVVRIRREGAHYSGRKQVLGVFLMSMEGLIRSLDFIQVHKTAVLYGNILQMPNMINFNKNQFNSISKILVFNLPKMYCQKDLMNIWADFAAPLP